MSEEIIKPGSLVLYKRRPARVARMGERLHIELASGNVAKVRPKDILLLHTGPLESLDKLKSQEGEVELAWEILCESPGVSHNLAELAELIYGEYTPSTAWAAWQWLDDGLYFRGALDRIITRTPEEVTQEQATRKKREDETRAWTDFLERAAAGQISPQEDAQYLKEVEELALGRKKDSRLLCELGRSERPESAQALLLECGFWDQYVDPYPLRLGLPLTVHESSLPNLADEPRADLTHLEAYAIDDRDNKDPDDAISLDVCQFDTQGRCLGGRIWVHIADVGAVVLPDSPVDLEARARGATIYLPEGAVPMLPLEAIEKLGLGLQDPSPALSFLLELNASGEVVLAKIQPSWVRVQRVSYERVEAHLDETPFRELYKLTQVYQARRERNGAIFIDLPEVIVRVSEGQVTIRAVSRLHSRNLVREAMLMVGEAAARFSIQHDIPFPFATQESSHPPTHQEGSAGRPAPLGTLAWDFAARRSLKRSQVSSIPSPHAGVGLPVYSRVTSPLRRYLDLVAHQQLRTHLQGGGLLNEQEMLERLGTSEAVIGNVIQAEALARRHWILVYLMQHPGWQGEGVLVDKQNLHGRLIIPELALETPIYIQEEVPLNSVLPLRLQGVNLPELEAYFAIL